MKILWLSHFIPYPPKGGILQRGYHLVKQVSQHHDVDLLAMNQPDLIGPLFGSVEEGVSEAREHLGQYCRVLDIMDIPYTDVMKKRVLAIKSIFTQYPYTINWLICEGFAEKLTQILADTKYDFIHFDTISLAPYLTYCGETPTSLDHHNIESHMLIRRAEKEPNLLKKWYFHQEGQRLQQYERLMCPKFGFHFTCSEVDSERLNKISPTSKVETIPNGVDIEFFKPRPEINTKQRLIFIGTLSWYPNIEAVNFLVDKVWPLIKSKYNDIELDIVGANPPDRIVNLASHDERLHVHGFVDDIQTILAEAICFVCPIKDGGGTKLKIVDALSAGKAIVADPIACEGIRVTNGENVVFAVTPDEYLEAISSIIEQPSLRTELQENARLLAESDYSYDSIGQKLADCFTHYQDQ